MDELRSPTPETRVRSLEWVVVGGVVAVSVVLRFVTTSHLWLDEALSVNISALSVGDLLEALRHDGHPPLYYLLLHGWIELVGDDDVAIRALSGIFSVATLPLAWIAGRRRAGTAGAIGVVLLTAIAPYSLRYATEARMYAMVSFLALAAWLLADDLRRRPDRLRWAALALATGALLLTHYWAIYLSLAAVSLLGWQWLRYGARDEAIRVGSALAVGSLLFVPWLPSFLYQATNTGTPWAEAGRPTRALMETVGGIGGGLGFPEGPLFGFAVVVLAVLGAVIVSSERTRTVLELRTVPVVRPEISIVAVAMAIGMFAGLVTAAAFQARYAAVVVPMLLVAAGVGLARLPAPWPRRIVAVAVIGLGWVGAAYNVVDDRTQGSEVATTIEAGARPGDLVVFCPDQIGPSTLRELDPTIDAVAVPTLERPDLVDWVDYADRNRSASADAVGNEILDRAGDGTIWYVFSPDYRTYEELCPAVQAVLSAARPNSELVLPLGDSFEKAMVLRFDP